MLLFTPVSAQEKFVLLKLKVLIEQLSVEPLLAWAAVIDTLPVASKYTTKSFAFGFGDKVSYTLTLKKVYAVLLE